MPHKLNADRRDKISKQKQRVTTYAEYDESLRRRGDLTAWISDKYNPVEPLKISGA